MQFTLVSAGTQSNVTLFVEGLDPLVAADSHPNFHQIVSELQASLDPSAAWIGEERVVALFDIAKTVEEHFRFLTERISVRNGRLYFDGDEVDNSLTKQVLRFLDEDQEDWVPLVNFFEKVQQNPQDYSRTQLFAFLDANRFTLTEEGNIVAYKGVTKGTDGTYWSIFEGSAIVDGQPIRGKIPNQPGTIIEMPRNEVAFDPHEPCSTGLHVATHSFARGFSRGAVLEVHINPRDVVSVPADHGAEKVRTCRYLVVGEVEGAYEQAVLTPEDEEQDLDGFSSDFLLDEGPYVGD